MGLFFKKKDSVKKQDPVQQKPQEQKPQEQKIDYLTRLTVQTDLDRANMCVRDVMTAETIRQHVPRFEFAKEASLKLVEDAEKYPSLFENSEIKPSEAYEALLAQKPELEKKIVDNFFYELERYLLNYTTEKGKKNNFKKKTDVFAFDLQELSADTFDYFQQQLHERFPEYLE